MTDAPFVVVGGGIVGASVAYHLGERTDAPVVVYERGELAAETTFRATAMVGVAGPDPYHRLKEYGFRLYNEFFADPEADPRYRQSGRLRVATSPDGARRLEALAAAAGDPDPDPPAAAKYANSLVDYVPGERLHERFLLPPLDVESAEGALYRPDYGYVQDESRTLGPRALAMEFVERARDHGATFETNTEVTDVRVDDGGVTGVELAGTEVVEAEAVVCAAGPWNQKLAARAGVDLPVGHVLSPVFSLELDDPLAYTLPAIKSHESGVGVHPKRDDTVLVTYTPDDPSRHLGDGPCSVDDTDAAAFREPALAAAEQLLPVLADADLVDEWVGVGTSTPDGKPIVGRTPVDGLALAVTMAGIQYAPAVGSIVARQLADGEETAYDDAVSLSRFDGDGG